MECRKHLGGIPLDGSHRKVHFLPRNSKEVGLSSEEISRYCSKNFL